MFLQGYLIFIACWLKTRFEIKERRLQMSSYSALEGQYKGSSHNLLTWSPPSATNPMPATEVTNFCWRMMMIQTLQIRFFYLSHPDPPPSYFHLPLLSEFASPEWWSVDAHLEHGSWQLVIDQSPLSVSVHLMSPCTLNSSFKVARSWNFTSEMSLGLKQLQLGQKWQNCWYLPVFGFTL